MAQLISQELVASQRRVYLRFMDCFGSEMSASVFLTKGPSVTEKVTSMLASMTATEQAVIDYGLDAKKDLTEQLAEGATRIAAAIEDAAARGISPPTA